MKNWIILFRVRWTQISEMFRRLLCLPKPGILGSMKCCSPSSVSSSKAGLHPGTISSNGSDATVLYCVEQTWSFPPPERVHFSLSHASWLESFDITTHRRAPHENALYGLALAFPHLCSPLCAAEWLDNSFCRRGNRLTGVLACLVDCSQHDSSVDLPSVLQSTVHSAVKA